MFKNFSIFLLLLIILILIIIAILFLKEDINSLNGWATILNIVISIILMITILKIDKL